MRLTRFRLLLAAAPAALVVTSAMPVHAETAFAAAGVVDGTVTLLPGLSVVPPKVPDNQTFTFGTTLLTGAAVDSHPCTAVGSVASATASGASIVETLAAAVGTVANVNVTGQVSGSLSGMYVRVGPVVAVELTGSLNCGGDAPTSVAVGVGAVFIPTSAVGAPVTQALFAGPFAAAG